MSKLIGRKVRIIKSWYELRPPFYFKGHVGRVIFVVGAAMKCPRSGYWCLMCSNGQFIPIECLRYLNNKEVKLCK